MKPVFTFLLCLCCCFVRAQLAFVSVNLDSNNYFSTYGYYKAMYDSPNVFIDTTYKTNTWKVGKPNKQKFTAAYTAPNAIVTDLENSCASGDTSVFTISMFANETVGLPVLSFYYKLDIDTGDTAYIEVSVDTGKNWINMLSDSIYKPLITTTNFSASMLSWDSTVFEAYHLPSNFLLMQRNLIYRFTFITGQSTKNRDGWMIDNFRFGMSWEDVPQINRNISATISPNPANQSVAIRYSLTQKTDLTVKLFDGLGREVKQLTIKNTVSGQTQFSTEDLPPGLYFYNLNTTYGQTTGKLLVSH